MKKNFLLILLISIFSWGFSQNRHKISLDQDRNIFRVTDQGYKGLTISYALSEIEFTNHITKKGEFVEIKVDNLQKVYTPGHPNLPVISKLIEIPFGAEVSFNITGYNEEIVNLNEKGITQRIDPAQPSVSKSEDPEKVPFYFDEKVYSTDMFFSEEIAVFEEVGFLRSTRLGRIEIRPIQYNPSKNILRILNDLEVEIIFNNADQASTEIFKKKFHSPYFQSIGEPINHLSKNKGLPTITPVTYVIVSDPMFQAQLQEFVEWKRLKGFHVIEAYTNNTAVGTTTTSIKNYLQNLYQNPSEGINPPTFILFVGDVQQIPAFSSSVQDPHVTDLYYCEYTNDNLPEVFYGRFSAQNTSQLQPQIDKTLLYEKYLMDDPSYLANAMLVAGVDGSYAPTAGNGAINYTHGYYVNEEHSINPLTYLYNDATNSTVMASNSSGASSSILSYMNQGLGFANYTAHCSPSGWGDPSFTTPNVNSLTNVGKYGVWIGNCCQSLMFNNDVCFGEAGLRKENGGAIGIIGGSESTYWNEDYWWAIGLKAGGLSANPTYEETGLGVYDAVYHDKINEVNNPDRWFVTQGQFNVVGNLAVESSTSNLKKYYWEIYHLMGDPSLMPYLWVPNELNVNLQTSVILLGMSRFSLTTQPYAQVALSQNGNLVAAGITNSEGGVDLEFDPATIVPGNVTLVVTAQNFQPYTESILVTPADEPYISLASFSSSTSPDYGAEVGLNITIKNLADDPYSASNVVATITTTSDFATIINNTLNIGTVSWGQEVEFPDAFTFLISDSVPDQTSIEFSITITGSYSSENYEWVNHFSINANAPEFSVGGISIDDNNEGIPGILDPGETANAIASISNTGHASISNVSVQLSSPSEYITLNDTSPFVIEELGAGESLNATFSISASSDTPLETSVSLKVEVVSGDYAFEESIELPIGEIPTYNIGSATSVSACLGRFFDSGGDDQNYSDNENLTITFFPGISGNMLEFTFNSFSLEVSYDYLYVYDGVDVNAPEIEGSPFTGNNSPGSFFATNEQGAITFKFSSDGLYNFSGWSADFTCFNPEAVPICAVNPFPNIDDIIEFEPITLEWGKVTGAIDYSVFIGKDAVPNEPTGVSQLNSYTINLEPSSNYFWKVVPRNGAGSPEDCPVWKFSTEELTSIIKMQNGIFTTCNANFFDSGGESVEYGNGENYVLTLFPLEPNNFITLSFSEFSLETGYDYIKFYDGTSTSAALIGSYTGSALPPKIKATNTEGALTINFTSDVALTEAGWSADVECEALAFDVTFEVVDTKDSPIQDAIVTLQGYDNGTTNSQGIVIFSDVIPQAEVPYSVSSQSFYLAEGVVNIPNEDVYQKVVLVPLSIPVEPTSKISIFPNPFTDSFTLTGMSSVSSLTLSSILGQTLLTISNNGDQQLTVGANELPSGLYFVKIHYNSGFNEVRMVIKR